MSADVNVDISVKLVDRVPHASQLTDLVGQLKTQVAGVGIPGMPLDQIQQLTAGFDLKLPDASNWHTAIPTDVADLLKNFPDGATLARPLGEPLAKIADVFAFDFMSEINRVADGLRGIQAPSLDSPEAMLDGLLASLSQISRLIQDSALRDLLSVLASLLGLDQLETLPETAAGMITQIQTVLHDKVESVLLCCLALGSTMATTERTERIVGAIGEAFSLESTNARFQALLAQYGDGADGLAARIAALNLEDPAQVAAGRAQLAAANEAFTGFTSSLVRDMAFTEASLALLDATALGERFKALAQTISKLDAGLLKRMADSLQALLSKIKEIFKLPDDLTIEEYKSLIQIGLAQANEFLSTFDPASITVVLKDVLKAIGEPFKKLEDFKAEVESIVRGAFQTVREAIEKIDLRPLRALVDAALNRLELSLKDLDTLFAGIRNTVQSALNESKAALDSVKAFVLDPNEGLKKRIEDLFVSFNQILEQVDLKGVMDEISAALQPISASLGQIEFAPVIDATVQALDIITETLKTVGPLLVTDALKQKLSEATGFLRKLDFDAIGKTLNDSFDEILKSVDEEALGTFKQEYQKVIDAVDQIDPAPALLALQHEVFDPLVAELEKIKPTELLKPLQSGYDAAVAELNRFKPTDTFTFITEFFDDLLSKFRSISPARLLEPVEKALNDIRDQVNSVLHIDQALELLDKVRSFFQPLIDALDLAPLLNRMSTGYAEMKAAVAAFDPRVFAGPLASLLDRLFSKTGIVVGESGVLGALQALQARTGDLNDRFKAMQATLQNGQAELNSLDVRGALATLRSKHGEVRAALAARPGPAELTVQVGLLDPMPVLSPLLPKIERVKAAYAARLAQFGSVIAAVAPTLQALGGIMEGLRALLSPLDLLKEMLLTPLRQFFPSRTFTGPKDVLLAFLDQIDPSQWRSEIDALLTTIQTKLKALLDDAVLNPIGETLHTIKGMVDLLSIQQLADAINGVFAEVEAAIQQFNPTPIIQTVDETYKHILALLERLNPADFIKQIDVIYTEDILGVVQAVSPQKLLLPPLNELFAKIKSLLVALDIEALFQPVLDRLKALDEQLGDGLHRTGASYKAMLDALDAATGGGGVSVSVTASVG